MEAMVNFIGVVHSELKDVDSAPKQGSEGAPSAWIEIYPKYIDGLRELKIGMNILLLSWMHLANRTILQVHPRGDLNRPLTGVFLTRSPDRPNPIGLHRVKVLGVSDRNMIQVEPLEAVDGTPIIDMKIAHSDG